MIDDLCPECGASEYITGEHRWLTNGDIVQTRNEKHRMLFIENARFDLLISNIEEIIGTSIEPIVITAMRRAARMYLERLLPEGVTEKVRNGELSLKAIDEVFAEVGRVMGFGKFQVVDYRYEQDEDDFITCSIAEPYCLPMCEASHAAAMEAILGYDHGITYREASPGLYYITAFPEKRPEELERRVTLEPHNPEKGDIELEACATCGGPKALSEYTWYPDRGVILNKINERRMVMIGPHELEPVFRELEEELGETIPRTVVEARRRFAKTGFHSKEDMKEAMNDEVLRKRLAIQGLGNLHSLKMDRQGLSMRLDNACQPLLIVGMIQGIFDVAFDVDSGVDWEYSEEGNLEIEVKPLA